MKTAKQSRIINPPPVRVLIVDDHAMLLDILKRQFDDDPAFEVIATANSLRSLMMAIDEHDIDVILLDIELSGESGLDSITHIRVTAPGVRIVMLSMFDHEIYRDRAFELGADAYVTKGARFADLRDLLLSGNDEPDVSAKGNRQIWRRSKRAQSVRLTLTGRELQVVRALAAGRREKDVAEELDISVSSVGTYLKRAMIKTGIDTRQELLRHAAALGTGTETD